MAERAGVHLVVVDAGIAEPFEHPAVRAVCASAPGRGRRGGAGDVRDGRGARARGRAGWPRTGRRGFGIVALGEMGIGNTTAASAICAALLPEDAEAVCGRGTGIADTRLPRKVAVVRRALGGE